MLIHLIKDMRMDISPDKNAVEYKSYSSLHRVTIVHFIFHLLLKFADIKLHLEITLSISLLL